MTAAAFQSGLAKLIVDPCFRERVADEGDAALPSGLDDLERRRLLAVAADPGLAITAKLHRGFRLGKLLTLLPLSFALIDRGTAAGELELFWRRRPPAGFYFLEEAVAFCDHLLARLEQGDLEAPLLAEIAAYERAALELQRARPEGEETPEQRVSFEHDPLPLIADLAAGRAPAPIPRRCQLVGRRTPEAEIEWRLVERTAAEDAYRH